MTKPPTVRKIKVDKAWCRRCGWDGRTMDMDRPELDLAALCCPNCKAEGEEWIEYYSTFEIENAIEQFLNHPAFVSLQSNNYPNGVQRGIRGYFADGFIAVYLLNDGNETSLLRKTPLEACQAVLKNLSTESEES